MPESYTAGQYVIIAENDRKKKALSTLKGKHDALLRDHRHLQEEREAEKKESYEVAEHLRKELAFKTDKIIKLEALIEKKDLETEEMKAHLEKQHSNKIEDLENKWEDRLKEKDKEVDQLTTELLAIQNFKNTKIQMEEEKEALKDEIRELKQGEDHRLRELERKFIEQNNKQKVEFEQKIEHLKRNAEADIDERLDASMKRILQQNRKLAEELHMHVQETSILQRDKKRLEEENKVLTRELDIKNEAEQEYAKRGLKQAQELKDTSKKIQMLEKSLSQSIDEMKGEKDTLRKKGEKEKRELQSELEMSRRALKLKTRELKNIRKLAREVLMQRSNVENFLISSLTTVKDHIKREQGMFPSLTQERGLPPASAKIDIGDLSWEDRERILRLLFSKINSQTQQASFSRLPEHSFEMSLPKLDSNEETSNFSLYASQGELAPIS
ncbi:basal body-orientation factor [Chloropicon primus]|uniref:Cilia- and flagella-associated protein 157 n=1 Tax=Chloropicon primus TaxID=1764295 RepID=A0A5B8MSJ5_9CHLO|nr:hypothetical protein A3770_10p60010 [Chloropicon primus]UPR02695.1 basal body-orientation factor [Chloropicon primus]|eukprot:QDZ23483.1 hypothetical protein A3770_10p60010 [Chloropicon primus]